MGAEAKMEAEAEEDSSRIAEIRNHPSGRLEQLREVAPSQDWRRRHRRRLEKTLSTGHACPKIPVGE